MRTFVLTLALAVLCGVATLAVLTYGDVQQTRNDLVALAAAEAEAPPQTCSHEKIGDRIIHLPEDGGAWHTTIVTRDEWQASVKDRELLAWFQTDPRLASLRAQTHFHHYTISNPLYRTRLAHAIPPHDLPAIVVQNRRGRVYYYKSGAALPVSSDGLAEEIAESLPRPDRPCPQPNPQPQPNPNVVPVQPIPNIGPTPLRPTPPKSDSSALVAAAAVTVAVGLLAFIGSLFAGFLGEVRKKLRI